MGRCNNRRTQQAAAELRNTPSRARFSSGPPRRNKGRGGKGRDGGRGGRGGDAVKAAVVEKLSKRVEQKQNKTAAPVIVTRRYRHPLANVDISKLDELVLPEESLQEVMKLLSDLNVKVVETATAASLGNTSSNQQQKPSNDTTTNTSLNGNAAVFEPTATAVEKVNNVDYAHEQGEPAITFNMDDDDDYGEDGNYDGKGGKQLTASSNIGGYEEQEEDYNEEEDLVQVGYVPSRVTDAGSDLEDIIEDDMGVDAEDRDGDEPTASLSALDSLNQAQEKFRDDPVYLHLTSRLSFKADTALRACQAIEDMVSSEDKDDYDNNENNSEETSNAKNSKQEQKRQAEKMAFAMDWLCLHCEEKELTAGFKMNPAMTSSIILMGTGRTTAIPHAKISVAKKLTKDRDWTKSILIQEKAVKFLPLGFQHSETYDTFKEYTIERLEEESSKTKSAMEDDEALRLLLTTLEREVLEEDEGREMIPTAKEHSESDLEDATTEREAEEEALEAIYADEFQIIKSSDDENGRASTTTVGLYRYNLIITPSEPLKEPARSDTCSLHVFVRPGYPVLEPPLMFFSNPTLPPSLLRRVNMELVRQVHQNLGAPAVFEIVNFLSTELLSLQETFMKEQKFKEMEAEQLRLRREAGHVLDDDIETGEEGGTMGRRQRAKMRAAAKAFDRPDVAQQVEAERRERQDARIERAREENKTQNIRQSRAERAIEQREKKRQEEEIKSIGRAAMNTAFISGASVEEAREASEKAILEYKHEHGLIEKAPPVAANTVPSTVSDIADTTNSQNGAPEALGEEKDEEMKDEAPTATPTTAAFMERLREMYEAAAKEKAEGGKTSAQRSQKGEKSEQELESYHLNPAQEEVEDEKQGEEPDENIRFPRPVAVPVGELKRVMDDVIATQKDQPWLIASEARAPEAGVELDSQDDSKMTEKCLEISRSLKDESERKYKSAMDWRKKNGGKKGKDAQRGQKGSFTPEGFSKMLSQRERLPAYIMRDNIISAISVNQVTVVAGDTGCGKTTQVPQLVLDELINRGLGAQANIIVTQPRRISAIGVSERIADERCERVGETCGYSIMLERKASRKTRLLLCTTGILLRRLQCDPDLASVSHVFVDEVHERDLNTDFLLIILRELLSRRKSLKLVLMSATLNAEAFSDYFGGCAVISIPGRAHPVTEYRLEDVLKLTEYEVEEGSDYALKDSAPRKFSKSALRKMYYPNYSTQVIHSLSIVNESVINYELLAALLEKICQNEDEGAILVFMPGMMEITKAIDEIYKNEFFQSPAVRICPLHSSLSTSEQTAVFEVPDEGIRKIVISTNIAETSITIEDVVYVVDCGRVKENRKDEINETPALVECWVSKASAKQRRGRAGRVRPGIAYHMFSSHTCEHELQDYQLPEMLRVGLEDLVLQILILDLGQPTYFLGRALNPPTEMSMRNSLKLLEELGAVECQWSQEEDDSLKLEEPKELDVTDPLTTSCKDMDVSSELTALGFHLATLPVDPRVGKMMIYGALFGCIEPALTIAASMSARNPFVSPFDKRDEADAARKQFAEDGSDHLAILEAVTKWKGIRRQKGDRAAQKFAGENYLSKQTLFQLEDLRKQFANLLVSIGFLPSNFRLEGAQGRGGNNRNGNNNNNNNNNGRDTENSTFIANVNAENMALVKAVLCAGLYPNIVVAPKSLVQSGSKEEAGEVAFQSLNKGDVHLHPCTIAFKQKRLESRYCCYHEMVKTKKTYVRDCTTVSPFALVLFGGTLVVYQDKGVVTVDEWLKFRIGRKPATLVKHLRAQMESMLLRKIVSPDDDVTASPVGKALIQSISTLLQREKAIKTERRDGAEIVRPWRESQDQLDQQGRGGREGRGRGRGRGGRGRGGRGRGRGGR